MSVQQQKTAHTINSPVHGTEQCVTSLNNFLYMDILGLSLLAFLVPVVTCHISRSMQGSGRKINRLLWAPPSSKISKA